MTKISKENNSKQPDMYYSLLENEYGSVFVWQNYGICRLVSKFFLTHHHLRKQSVD